MNARIRTLAASALLGLLALGSQACLTRRMTGIRDHGTQPVTLVETLDHYNYFFTQRLEHVFWQCAENNGTLTCRRLCGNGPSDNFRCPQGGAFAGFGGTNIR